MERSRIVNSFPDPTPEMLAAPEFEAVWQGIKTWNINIPKQYIGYMGATGNHVRVILDALREAGCLRSEGRFANRRRHREILRECNYDTDAMSREELVTALANELHDVQMLADHCSKIYVWATNDRISKPTTEPSIVIAVAEDVREDEMVEIIADKKRSMNDEINQLIQESENRIEQALRKQRKGNIIFLIVQYLMAVVSAIALYNYFRQL